ncbi:4-hydroxy-tetrahydrodipicolinate reductase [Stomatohabitans albus]|uniref:4-hydroxy-tetrahydrodipicolinate reductase n=1 Tax=Stomatohabitans albus TaxID=3110766 RepID=UPI00300CE3C0
MITVAVIGARGRMGSTVCETVEHTEGMELVAAIDQGDDRDAIVKAGAQVCVEFSTPATVHDNVAWLLDNGIHAVVGATGMTSADIDDLRRRATTVNCLVVPNFAISAVLLMQFAAQAAKYMPNVEIIELHHDRKVDAPSGTAIHTAEAIATNRTQTPEICGPAGHPARGSEHHGVMVHSVRLPGLLAHEEVIFTAQGQALTLRQDSFDRYSFMPGVVMAIQRIHTLNGLAVGLDAVMA